ncbi:hemin ABC transporter substrate-binding protein [Aeromicrobium sp. CF4.19]|uniref:heme/hemin ABC transporter substrate-binding protein n=1 Tax=Aeromicrobium sp. CF4.19 TaxID=3373082 RepID=UPI003EE78EA0
MPLRRVAVAGLFALLATAGCGALPSVQGSEDSEGAPPLAGVSPLEDPREWEGASHAAVAATQIEPVAQSPAQDLPATVTDAQDTQVTVEDTSRILALDIYGTLSQTVFELGLGDSVVGRDVSTQFPEAEDLPLVTGNGHELNAEAILALDPTVLITDTSLGPWDVVLQVRKAGIPVVVVDSQRSIENTRSLTMEVADALGVPQQGTALADRIEADVEQVADQIASIAPTTERDRLRMVFLYVRGQAGVYYMFGQGSGADELITALGGHDVTEEIGWEGMKPVNDEGIIAAQPDVILMMTKGLDSVGGVDGLLERLPALGQTPAGQKQRIVDMTDSQVLSYGPRTAEVLNSLAVSVYAPEAVQ